MFELPNTHVIQILGADAEKVVNNLCTNDLKKLALCGDRGSHGYNGSARLFSVIVTFTRACSSRQRDEKHHRQIQKNVVHGNTPND